LGDTTQAALEAFAACCPKYRNVADLYDNLNDGDADNDPYIISLRSADDYAKGHVKGAVNMSVKTMWTAEALATIPTDREVVVYCYTGQTSAQASAGLRALGYDAWSMLSGMQAWSANADVYVKRYNPDTVPDFPTEGTAGAAAAPATLPTTGGIVFPVQNLVLALGFATASAGAVLYRRNK